MIDLDTDSMSGAGLQTPQPSGLAASIAADASFEQACGEFALTRLIRAGLLTVAKKAFAKIPLEDGEAAALLRLSLPMAALLARLSCGLESLSAAPVIRPVIFIPLAALLDDKGRRTALSESLSRLRNAAASGGYSRMHLRLDRWSGRFFPPDFLDLVAELTESRSGGAELTVISPSAEELSSAVEAFRRDSGSGKTPAAFLARLARLGLEELDCGTDFSLATLACREGMPILYRQQVTQRAEQPANFEESLESLSLLRRHLVPTGLVRTLAPTGACLRPGRRQDAAFAVEALRGLTIARLVIPATEFFRAEPEVLGLQTARLAIAYGANDLGYAAVDAETAAVLRIPTITSLLMRKAGASSSPAAPSSGALGAAR